jgi:SMI1 / KNR4 family (SUKH-1)
LVLGEKMTQVNWKKLLQELNQSQLERAIEMNSYQSYQYSQELLESGWLGRDGATEEQIVQAEIRLGITLPNSYKDFLRVSNGWGDWRSAVPDYNLLPVEEIDWFPAKNPDWVGYTDCDVPDEFYFVYGDEQDCVDWRSSYLEKALQISSWGETWIFVLNPQVTLQEGEWEAWYMDSKLPGVDRYKTFGDLVGKAYESKL